MLSTQNLLIMLGIAAVLFGGKKLPELGRGIGEGIRHFKKGISETAEMEMSPTREEPLKEKKA
jgi:sec-independent protein translocase protein TatA